MGSVDRFSRNLRAHRTEAGLSQERLAAICKLHRTEISLLERGEREPRLSTMIRLSRGLNVPVAALLEGID
ncbi:MAG TPA: helix-turn-helix transcriptional regulator [Gaiellaceae bacterium]|nr:helix-turn-helix transcriptional regulator [Gaiellaceae bacterium]